METLRDFFEGLNNIYSNNNENQKINKKSPRIIIVPSIIDMNENSKKASEEYKKKINA